MRRWSALLLCAVVSGCGGSASSRSAYVDTRPAPEEPLVMKSGDAGRYGGRFVVVSTSGPETFNPLVYASAYSADIGDAMYVGLTQYRLDTQERAPSLASSWSCTDDALSCTFNLR